jgi:death on curing protein
MRNWVDALPSEQIQFLSVDEAIAIHDRVIEKFSGEPGIRDTGLLESALFRPQTGYYNDLSEMAAALFESLLLNHAFFDGNKRVAFFASDVFLRLNGWKFSVDAAAAHSFLIDMLERGNCNYQMLLPWVRDSIAETG